MTIHKVLPRQHRQDPIRKSAPTVVAAFVKRAYSQFGIPLRYARHFISYISFVCSGVGATSSCHICSGFNQILVRVAIGFGFARFRLVLAASVTLPEIIVSSRLGHATFVLRLFVLAIVCSLAARDGRVIFPRKGCNGG